MPKIRIAVSILALVAMSVPALAAGDFGLWRAPTDNAQPSSAGTSAGYNPSINGTAGSGQNTATEGDAISSRTGLGNATETLNEINSSGQASPQGTPGGH